MKKTWSAINDILNRSSKHKTSDIFLNDNGKILTNQKSVANKFNDYFINVADNLSKKIDKPSTKFQDYLKNPNEHSFYLSETTQHEVEDLIMDLAKNKASDIYGLSANFVKSGGPTLAQIITILFKYIGFVSNQFKFA